MLEFIGFLAVFAYFVYNVAYMSKHSPFGFWAGMKMFLFQGAIDFVGLFKK